MSGREAAGKRRDVVFVWHRRWMVEMQAKMMSRAGAGVWCARNVRAVLGDRGRGGVGRRKHSQKAAGRRCHGRAQVLAALQLRATKSKGQVSGVDMAWVESSLA